MDPALFKNLIMSHDHDPTEDRNVLLTSLKDMEETLNNKLDLSAVNLILKHIPFHSNPLAPIDPHHHQPTLFLQSLHFLSLIISHFPSFYPIIASIYQRLPSVTLSLNKASVTSILPSFSICTKSSPKPTRLPNPTCSQQTSKSPMFPSPSKPCLQQSSKPVNDLPVNLMSSW